MTKAPDEVARLFSATGVQASNAPVEAYPGYHSLVVARGELRGMVWGSPVVRKRSNGQPLKLMLVSKIRADKLDSFMWRTSFGERRCLIPV